MYIRKIYAVFLFVILLFSACAAPGGQEPTETGPAYSPAPSASAAASPSPSAAISPAPSATPGIAPAMSMEAEKLGSVDGFFYMELNDVIKKRITGLSYPENDRKAKIRYGDLRYVCILYYDFKGNVKAGELIVHRKLADEVMEIFCELYRCKYPFTSVRLVDDFDADDTRSMEANNTSAFNYRTVAGSKKLSLHSYGMAIDINPKLNPYVKKSVVSPKSSKKYADRSKDFAGKIDKDDLAYKLFKKHGWEWGGDWKTVKDYQHFEKDVR
ncbi:MAG TPA: M15 family metallopeptidase [Feifaniaceae bacterium]|nr:M15 family metallopeptidase [Feifaniaceae bacterium]